LTTPFSVSHTFEEEGIYTLSVSATDDQHERSDEYKITLHVVHKPEPCSIPPWKPNQAYVKADWVFYEQLIFEARHWSYGEKPSDSGPWGPWKPIGNCEENAASSVESNTFSLFPNPASENLTVSSSSKGMLIIIDAYQQVVFEDHEIKKQFSLNIQHFPPGVYTVTLKDKNTIKTRQVIIQ
jgi:PKD repeat protein